jgi:hypothetical protein
MGGQTALNLCLEADEKEFGKISGKNDRCWCKRYQHNREQSNSNNYLKIGYHLRLQKYVLPTLEVKKLHKNLVSFSDTSFLYFRRYRSGCV